MLFFKEDIDDFKLPDSPGCLDGDPITHAFTDQGLADGRGDGNRILTDI